MNKKKMIISGVVIIIAIAISGIWFISRHQVLAELSKSCTKPDSSGSMGSFQGEAGDKIKITYNASVKSGTLVVYLSDSKGNIVYQCEDGKDSETITLDATDSYQLTSRYEGFIGSYKAKCMKVR